MTNPPQNARQLVRRQFAVAALTALFAAAIVTTTACDDEGGPVSVGPGGGGRTGSISANHGHEAALTREQLDAGTVVSLDIRGTADHTHTVTLSGSEVVEIRNGQRVTTTSTTETSPLFGTHSHSVTFN